MKTKFKLLQKIYETQCELEQVLIKRHRVLDEIIDNNKPKVELF